MIYATLDVEWFEDPAYLDLRDADPGHPDRFLRCVAWAKRCNEKGLVLRADGVPLDARAMSRMHDGRGEDHVTKWEGFLSLAVSIGLLGWDDGDQCFYVSHWRRWHRKPSDDPDKIGERVAKHRELKRNANTEKCNAPVTPCNACNATELELELEQSIAIAEHTPLTPRPENPVPQVAPTAAAGLGGGNVISFPSPPSEGRKFLLEAAAAAYRLVEKGRSMDKSAASKLDSLEAIGRKDFPTADAQVLADVLTYAADQVAHEQKTGVFKGNSPWAITLHRASGLIAERLEWGLAVERGKKFGEPHRPFKFRPSKEAI